MCQSADVLAEPKMIKMYREFGCECRFFFEQYNRREKCTQSYNLMNSKKYFHKKAIFLFPKVSQVLNGMTRIVHKNPNWRVQLQSNGQFSATQHAIKSSHSAFHFFRVVQYVRNLIFSRAISHVVKMLIPLCLFVLADDIAMNIFGELTRILNGSIKLRRSACIPLR